MVNSNLYHYYIYIQYIYMYIIIYIVTLPCVVASFMKLQPLAAVPALARCPASAKRLQCTTEAIANADHVLNGHQEKQGILR
jgi:hypothetical protein